MDCRYSVIVPVYNAEKTLRRCVDSLLPQLGGEDEILLINDGSKDGSAALCAEYAAQSSQIVYIEKPNGGVSSARNAGLDAARGRYVLFVDSDDYVPPTLFAQISALEEEVASGWDWIVFSNCVDNGAAIRESRNAPFRATTREKALPAILDGICRKLLNPPWAKVYRRAILEEARIRFPLGVSIAEDRAFNIRYSMHVAAYLVSEQIGYYVNTENEQSLSRKRHKDLPEQFRRSGEYVQNSIQNSALPEAEKEQYRRAYSFGVCRTVYKDAKDLRRDEVGWLGRQKALWKRCREINGKHMRYPATNYCRKISLPVRLYQTWFIDLVAKRLLKKS
ncbi:MAG: glycosyltransferase family 2 protein [Oscillospiraceae bacterium]|nr:glycosyltransferase family 2 protein [Oscillospiraceae bacterium]